MHETRKTVNILFSIKKKRNILFCMRKTGKTGYLQGGTHNRAPHNTRGKGRVGSEGSLNIGFGSSLHSLMFCPALISVICSFSHVLFVLH